jgi:hypothetical protein
MPNINDLSLAQLRRAVDIKLQIETLQSQLDSIEVGGGGETPSPDAQPQTRKKRRMSRAGRAAIAAAAKARWAAYRGKGAAKTEKPAKKRKVSAAVKAKLSAMAKARWAKVKAEGKKGL